MERHQNGQLLVGLENFHCVFVSYNDKKYRIRKPALLFNVIG